MISKRKIEPVPTRRTTRVWSAAAHPSLRVASHPPLELATITRVPGARSRTWSTQGEIHSRRGRPITAQAVSYSRGSVIFICPRYLTRTRLFQVAVIVMATKRVNLWTTAHWPGPEEADMENSRTKVMGCVIWHGLESNCRGHMAWFPSSTKGLFSQSRSHWASIFSSATWNTFFSFILLIHEGSHREVYQEFQSSYDIFCRWRQGLFRPQVPCTPSLHYPIASTQSQQSV